MTDISPSSSTSLTSVFFKFRMMARMILPESMSSPMNSSDGFRSMSLLESKIRLGSSVLGILDLNLLALHAEVTLMGLLTYFSEPNPSSRVDYWNALQDSTIAERMEVLVGPAMATTNKAIGVGKKCCWCCSTLVTILQDKSVSIERGSHGIIYPWSPPRVGLDASVLQKLEDRWWDELHRAIERSRPLSLTRRTSFCNDMQGIVWKRVSLG
ncbi:hypothetical protein M405DRAFT_507775 [Rhizopogon salebrosus TDB-379]|nr:hypothetical protein M405DRAFT_507775 [Rhizopogon salebrosus TDB-379]